MLEQLAVGKIDIEGGIETSEGRERAGGHVLEGGLEAMEELEGPTSVGGQISMTAPM